MKLYIDDIRPAPEGWQQARTVTDAIRFLDMFGLEVTDISFDHDISYAVEVAGTQRPFPSPENFTAVARYVCACALPKLQSLTIHSANPVGAKEIENILCKTGLIPQIKASTRVNRLESEV